MFVCPYKKKVICTFLVLKMFFYNLGLNDQAKEGVFKWSSDEYFSSDSYTNWAQNEPNDLLGKENCVEILATNGQWNDNPCSDRLSFMCEHPLGNFYS